MIAVWLLTSSVAYAQPTAALQGRVFDPSGAVLPGASVRARHLSTGFVRTVQADDQGRYYLGILPPGIYRIVAAAPSFQAEVIEQLRLDVGRTRIRDFRLDVGATTETVTVTAERSPIDRATSALSHVVTTETVQEMPLNGRHVIDLGLLVPGSVSPSQTGFSSRPIRGIGSLAFNTAGNREEAVAFVVNGVTSNNLTFGSLGFQPPTASIQEFKIENSTFGAEFGHVSGAVMNLVTRSGTNQFRGEASEAFRNDALDARNFFELEAPEPHPFNRHQFNGFIGGPIVRNRAFFQAGYEGFRQRQGLTLNGPVLSDAQRAAVADPVVRQLIPLIPRANVIDANGTPRFVGMAPATVDIDTWTGDVTVNLGDRLRLHGYYGGQRARTREPGTAGNSIPGFGHRLHSDNSLITVSVTHVLGASRVNEARFGRSALAGTATPATLRNPAEFGIGNGVTRAIGLPQIVVAGGLNFGGPANYPTGRDDASYVVNDTLSLVGGRHTWRIGGEYRRFLNENFSEGTGSFNFPSVESFLAGQANAFSITLGERRNHIDQRAVGAFVQDRFAVGPYLTLDMGLRYEWHVTPTERDDQFVVFDADSQSLVRVGVDVDGIYRQNNRNLEPRLGLVWDVSKTGRTVVRAAFGVAVDQPSTTAVSATAANPPFATPLTAAGAIPLGSAAERTIASGLAPTTIDPAFRNASLRSWNVNVQQELSRDAAVTVGYIGSSGRHLRIGRNLNQPVEGVRPFAALSPTSPILPNTPLGNITQIESTGFSNYQALWVSAVRRLSNGSLYEASYTLSRSLDTNSLNSSQFNVQDGYDIPNQYGPSDFDARHRLVLSAVYALPFTRHALVRDWLVAAAVQSQSGNPVNIVTGNSTLNGVPNTVRPDVTGPIRIIGSVDQWFDPSVFVAANHFGNLARNVVVGPAFHSTDVSVTRTVHPARAFRLQFRVDVFNLFNQANLGPPGNVVGGPTFGRITRTRLPTGEAGSSRQSQLSVKLLF